MSALPMSAGRHVSPTVSAGPARRCPPLGRGERVTIPCGDGADAALIEGAGARCPGRLSRAPCPRAALSLVRRHCQPGLGPDMRGPGWAHDPARSHDDQSRTADSLVPCLDAMIKLGWAWPLLAPRLRAARTAAGARPGRGPESITACCECGLLLDSECWRFRQRGAARQAALCHLRAGQRARSICPCIRARGIKKLPQENELSWSLL